MKKILTILMLLFSLTLIAVNTHSYDMANCVGYWSLNENSVGLGKDLVTNGDFETDTTGSSVANAGTGGDATISRETASPISGTGSLKITQTTAPTEYFRPNILITLSEAPVSGKNYHLHFKTKLVSGSIKIDAGNGIGIGQASGRYYLDHVFSGEETHDMIITAGGTTQSMTIYFDGSLAAGFVLLIDDISVREVGTGFTDLSGNGNLGTSANVPTFSADQNGVGSRAMVFNGTTDVINCGSGASIDNIFDSGGTVSAWINPSSDGEIHYGYVFQKRVAAGWIVYANSETAGYIKLSIHVDFSGTDGIWTTNTAIIPIDNWTHVVLSYDNDAVANNPTFYINGIPYTVTSGLTEDQTPVGTRVSDATNTLYLGNRAATDRTFDGSLSDCLIYNTALTSDQVSKLYETGRSTATVEMDGRELVTNGGFDTDSDWTKGAGWTISGGKANSTAAAWTTIRQTGSFITGRTYLFTFTITSITSGGVKPLIGDGGVGTLRTTTGTFSEQIVNSGANPTNIYVRPDGSGFVGSIDNVSVIDITNSITYPTTTGNLVLDMPLCEPYTEGGAELVLGDNSTFDSDTGNWVDWSGGLFDVVGDWSGGAGTGIGRITFDSDSTPSGTYLNTTQILKYDKQYQITIKAKWLSGSGSIFIGNQDIGTGLNILTPTGTETTFSISIAHGNSGNGYCYIGMVVSDGSVLLIDNVSVIELNATTKDLSYSCIHPDTRIFTDKGYIKALDIKNGDSIYQSNGEYSMIKKIIPSYCDGDMYRIKARGVPAIELTAEHEVLIVDSKQVTKHRNITKQQRFRGKKVDDVDFKTKWIKTKDLEVGDYFIIPKPKLESKEQTINPLPEISLNQFVMHDVDNGLSIEEIYEKYPNEKRETLQKCRNRYLNKERKLKNISIYGEQILDEEWAELFGWYVAEGYTTYVNNTGSYTIQFALSYTEQEEAERIAYLLKKKVDLDASVVLDGSCHKITARSKQFKTFLDESFGRGAKNKYLPDWLMNSTKEVTLAFLLAYNKGDGCIINQSDKDKYYQTLGFSTSSPRLVTDVSRMIMKLDVCPNIVDGKPTGEQIIAGKTSYRHESWDIRITGKDVNVLYPELKTTEQEIHTYFQDENNFYVRVSSVNKIDYEGVVYDFTTDTHTIGMPFIIHNSADGTVSGATIQYDGLANVSAGIAYVPSNVAIGEWEFNVNKGADGNSLEIPFIAQSVGSLPNGYTLRLNTVEQVIIRAANSFNLFATAASYVTINTDYRIKVTRTEAGVFTAYIKGGAFGWDAWTTVSVAGGSGTNPVTDNTYTSSSYFVADLDASDTISDLHINGNTISLQSATQSTGSWTTTAPSYDFDGTDDIITISGLTNAKSIGFWMSPDTITEAIFEETDDVGVSVSSGTMSYASWDNCFVDGIDTDTVTTGWHHIILTSTTDVDISALRLGLVNAAYYDGYLKVLKGWSVGLSTTEITYEFNTSFRR